MYERIRSNIEKTWGLIAFFTLLIAVVGFFFGYFLGVGWWGLVVAVLFAIAMSWGSYFSSDKIALAAARAKPAQGPEYKQLHDIVAELTIAAGLPAPPRLFVIEDDAPNAFATGRDPKHAAIAATSGLLQKMNR